MEAKPGKIEVGEQVESVIIDCGTLPPSFQDYVQQVERQEAFSKTYGLGVAFTQDSERPDPDLERFFKYFPHVSFNPETDDPAGTVTADILHEVVEDFRTTELFKSDPTAEWQLYGEFSIASVSAEALAENRATNDVSDELTHVDFVPPEDPCMTYFASSKHPTEFREGSFMYRGNTISNYADGEAPLPEPSPKDKFPSGHLIRCDDSRTALHNGDVPDEGYKNRVLLRLYVAKKK